MKKYIIASVLVSALSGNVGASTQTLQFTPISKTIIGDSYTAYEASKICAKELFSVPSAEQQFIYISEEAQSWALTFQTDVLLNSGIQRITARLSTNVESDKINVMIDTPMLGTHNAKETSTILNKQSEVEEVEDRLYDTYESFMICVSDF
ncbi:hypothetical protein [Photobacterium sp. DNB22_13_2]